MLEIIDIIKLCESNHKKKGLLVDGESLGFFILIFINNKKKALILSD